LTKRGVEGVLLVDGDEDTFAVGMIGRSFSGGAGEGAVLVDDCVGTGGAVDTELSSVEDALELGSTLLALEAESFGGFGEGFTHGDGADSTSRLGQCKEATGRKSITEFRKDVGVHDVQHEVTEFSGEELAVVI
jgi:hypothetical protein